MRLVIATITFLGLYVGGWALPDVVDQVSDGARPIGAASGPISVRLTNDGLEIENRSAVVVRVAAVERQQLERTLGNHCVGSCGCGLRIAAGTTAILPYRRVDGYRPTAEEAILFWWSAPIGGDGMGHTGVRRLTVPL
jgi:hypothetical protein